MIRAVIETDNGPLIVLGVVEENLRRLRAGKPMHVDLGKLLVQSAEGSEPGWMSGQLQLAVLFGETHRDIVEELARNAPVDPSMLAAADQLDEQLRDEGLI